MRNEQTRKGPVSLISPSSKNDLKAGCVDLDHQVLRDRPPREARGCRNNHSLTRCLNKHNSPRHWIVAELKYRLNKRGEIGTNQSHSYQEAYGLDRLQSEQATVRSSILWTWACLKITRWLKGLAWVVWTCHHRNSCLSTDNKASLTLTQWSMTWSVLLWIFLRDTSSWGCVRSTKTWIRTTLCAIFSSSLMKKHCLK